MPRSLQRVRQRRGIGLVLLSAVWPGSAQLVAGRVRLGRMAGRLFAGAVGVLLVIGLGLLVARGFTVGLLVRPGVLGAAGIVLWVLYLVWLFLLFDAWRLARPLGLEQRGRLGLMLLTLGLALSVGAATTLATNALAAVGNVAGVFQGGGNSETNQGRYNVLLLGADAAGDREGLRPDSINVASIDAETGRTVIFGLPRNLEGVRFPESSPLHALYPEGYTCPESACLLNAVYQLGMEHADRYPGQHAGRAAMKEAVGESLGLEINYYALIDMHGFEALIDAMGGIRLNLSKAIPIGGGTSEVTGYLGPGENLLLDGYEALWVARSRAESDDYERMARQKCVMAAMAKQLDPATIATRFLELSEAGADIVSTDVGPEAIVELTELALRAKELPIESVDFGPPLIASGNPDFELIRATVAESIAAAEALDEESTTPEASATPSAEATPQAPASQSQPTADASPRASASQSEPEPVASASAAGPVCSVP